MTYLEMMGSRGDGGRQAATWEIVEFDQVEPPTTIQGYEVVEREITAKELALFRWAT